MDTSHSRAPRRDGVSTNPPKDGARDANLARGGPALPASRARRAGEDDAAIARALWFSQRVATTRLRDGDLAQSLTDGLIPVARALADLAVDGFCDWCLIDDATSAERLVETVAARVGSTGRFRVGTDRDAVESLIAAVSHGAGRGRLPADVTKGLPWVAVTALLVHDNVVATMTFGREADAPGFGPFELTAIDEVTWGTAIRLERADLRRQREVALNSAEHVARQLRSLVATAIGLRSVTEVERQLALVAAQTRSLFSAGEALVLDWASGRASGALASADGEVTLITGHEDFPVDSETFAVNHRGWLAAEMFDSHGALRGVIAARREYDPATDDVEIISLVSQLATAALDGAMLSATIAESEARWRALVESAPVGIVEVGLDRRVRWWNRRAASVLNWPDYDAVPATPAWPEQLVSDLSGLWDSLSSATPPTHLDVRDVTVRDSRDFAITAQIIEGGRDDGLILTLIDDVTDRRRMTEELRHAHAMELRGQVAGSIIHDFNNLLTVISGHAELLARHVTDEFARTTIDEIVATSARALALATQLQTIGRTQATEPRVVDPARVIASNAEVIERIVGSRVTVHWRAPVTGYVRVDPDRFEQMVLNLVLNARDAMPDGGELTLDLSRVSRVALDPMHQVERDGDYVVLSVSDSGVGMDEATRRRCFEPYFTTKSTFKGTGLGLAAARRLAQESGGWIDCRSTAGEGSTFEVVLPVAEGESLDPADDSPGHPEGATILLVEDDDAQRRLASEILRRGGHRVVEVASGEEALATFEAHPDFDLVVSDVVLGGLSGDQLVAQLQGAHPDLGVVVLSGSATGDVIVDLDPSLSVFLAKPFRPSQLVDHVEGVLARRMRRQDRSTGSNR